MPAKKQNCSETELQIRFFTWIRRLALVDSRLHLIYSVPNEGPQSNTRRLKMYRMGLTRGVSDINVDLPSYDGKYGYLRIELKSQIGRQSPDQANFQRLVTWYGGGKYVLCRSFDDIISELTQYFGPLYNWDELYQKYATHDRMPASLRRNAKNNFQSIADDFV